VPLNIKRNIWQNKFIDLSILLKLARDLQDSADSQGEIRIHNGQLCLVKEKSNVFLNIDKWTSAFTVFATVLLERFPSKLQEMFEYLRDIRLAANRSLCWYKYEEQFRLKVANNPNISWGQVDNELWLLYVSNPSP
jgi:hypothetical protein